MSSPEPISFGPLTGLDDVLLANGLVTGGLSNLACIPKDIDRLPGVTVFSSGKRCSPWNN